MKKIKIVSRVIFTAIIMCTVLYTGRSQAQVFTGGDVNITFLNGLNVDVAPTIGYRYKKFSVGVSPFALYTALGTSTSIAGDFSFGTRLFVEYVIWKGIFIHAEGQVMNTGYIDPNGVKLRNWVMGMPIGAGYEYKITKNLLAKGMLLYDPFLDLNLDQNSPQANPQVRGGISYLFN